jgi:hypothetical protein
LTLREIGRCDQYLGHQHWRLWTSYGCYRWIALHGERHPGGAAASAQRDDQESKTEHFSIFP